MPHIRCFLFFFSSEIWLATAFQSTFPRKQWCRLEWFFTNIAVCVCVCLYAYVDNFEILKQTENDILFVFALLAQLFEQKQFRNDIHMQEKYSN